MLVGLSLLRYVLVLFIFLIFFRQKASDFFPCLLSIKKSTFMRFLINNYTMRSADYGRKIGYDRT